MERAKRVMGHVAKQTCTAPAVMADPGSSDSGSLLQITGRSTREPQGSEPHPTLELRDVDMFMLRQYAERGVCYWPATDAERKRLDHLVSKGMVVKPYRGHYVLAEWWASLNALDRHLCVARTLAIAHPGWVFCGFTAAAIMGWNPPYSRLEKVQVVRGERERRRSTGVVEFHRRKNARCVTVKGLLVTLPEQTALDCMCASSFADAVAIADASTRRCGWNDLYLFRYTQKVSGRGCSGITKARAAALLADGRSESGGESIARANMVLGGYALPELQVAVPNPLQRGGIYRVDYTWRTVNADGSEGVVYGELDGREKYFNSTMVKQGNEHDVLFSERRREAGLTLTSSAIVRFSFEEANNPRRLWKLLDAYAIPTATPPLELQATGAPAVEALSAYLKQNANHSPIAAEKLMALQESLGTVA